MNNIPLLQKHEFVIFYDGECPICVREMKLLKCLDRRSRLILIDIHHPEFSPEFYGLNHEQLMQEIHGLLPGGQIITGVAVFRKAYQAVGLGWLLTPTGWPVLKIFFDALYIIFAKNRIKISRLLGRRPLNETDKKILECARCADIYSNTKTSRTDISH